ncbi:hypothetical protein ACRALDRAFT_1064302 [Sodiomyces alcalophilus JCM 7366]|uniref:uncharacterized protein n=1 Tax=Sodiomyces alcalophilus JCM 7366 TaxID=591952 RepID=UPI0039B5540C
MNLRICRSGRGTLCELEQWNENNASVGWRIIGRRQSSEVEERKLEIQVIVL